MSQIEPGDREEMLLQGILNGDTTTNIEPGSRKEMLLKAILENGGGSSLPEVTSEDNGKVLGVVEGEWAKTEMGAITITPTAEESNTIQQVLGQFVIAVMQNPNTMISIDQGGTADMSAVVSAAVSAKNKGRVVFISILSTDMMLTAFDDNHVAGTGTIIQSMGTTKIAINVTLGIGIHNVTITGFGGMLS